MAANSSDADQGERDPIVKQMASQAVEIRGTADLAKHSEMDAEKGTLFREEQWSSTHEREHGTR